LIDEIRDALTNSDDAIRNKVDQFFNSPTSAGPQLNISISNGQLKINVESERLFIGDLLSDWQNSLISLNSSSDLESFGREADNNLSEVKTLVDLMSLAVNSLSPSSNLSQTTIDGYKSDISSARTSIGTSISGLSTALAGFRTAKSNLLIEEKELALKLAGSTGDALAFQEAKVEASKASVEGYKARLLKTIIRAPITGTVTEQEAKVGEIVSVGSIIVSLISESDFEIESNVPEADISNLKVGQKADVTLDAYDSNLIFKATVTSVNPAETIIDGVATFSLPGQYDFVQIISDGTEWFIISKF